MSVRNSSQPLRKAASVCEGRTEVRPTPASRSPTASSSSSDCGPGDGVPASGFVTVSPVPVAGEIIDVGTEVASWLTVLDGTAHDPVCVATAERGCVEPEEPTIPASWIEYW